MAPDLHKRLLKLDEPTRHAVLAAHARCTYQLRMCLTGGRAEVMNFVPHAYARALHDALDAMSASHQEALAAQLDATSSDW